MEYSIENEKISKKKDIFRNKTFYGIYSYIIPYYVCIWNG